MQVKIAGAGLLLMAASVCKTLIPIWSKRQDYSFGYLTPLFVLYVLFDRKEKIAEFFEKRREKSAPIGAVSLAADFAFGGMFACGIATFLAFAFLFFLTQNQCRHAPENVGKACVCVAVCLPVVHMADCSPIVSGCGKQG